LSITFLEHNLLSKVLSRLWHGLFKISDCVHAIKRGVERFEKREKDVKRGENKEKSMCMEKKEREKNRKEKRKKIYV
jgi:hypothetical protein